VDAVQLFFVDQRLNQHRFYAIRCDYERKE
jgi:hypothetical protein